jgi:hypothetical protein
LREDTSNFGLTADPTGGAGEAGAAAEQLQIVSAATKAERTSSLCAAVAVVGAAGEAALGMACAPVSPLVCFSSSHSFPFSSPVCKSQGRGVAQQRDPRDLSLFQDTARRGERLKLLSSQQGLEGAFPLLFLIYCVQWSRKSNQPSGKIQNVGSGQLGRGTADS